MLTNNLFTTSFIAVNKQQWPNPPGGRYDILTKKQMIVRCSLLRLVTKISEFPPIKKIDTLAEEPKIDCGVSPEI
jgi:hypothetical protein